MQIKSCPIAVFDRWNGTWALARYPWLLDLICSTGFDVKVHDNLPLLFLCVFLEYISLNSADYDFISFFQILWTRASTYGMVFKEFRLWGNYKNTVYMYWVIFAPNDFFSPFYPCKLAISPGLEFTQTWFYFCSRILKRKICPL